jgi:exopolysaccharide production protein ExoZ
MGIAMIGLGLTWFTFSPSTYYNQAFGPGALYRVLAWGIPAAMLVYGTWSLERRLGGRAFDVPVLIGSASYSIYLFHQLVLLKFHGVAGFTLSAVAGIAAFLSIERYIMRARPRWSTRRMLRLEGPAVRQS